MSHREAEKRIKAELERHPEVEHRFEHGGRHPKVVLTYRGQSTFVTYSLTRVGSREVKNDVCNIRRAIRGLTGVAA